MQIIELPTLADEGVAKKILELDSVTIQFGR
jgi:hypothetical protein